MNKYYVIFSCWYDVHFPNILKYPLCFENVDTKTDYLKILNSLSDLPFSVGKKLLLDYLQGNEENESIQRNHLDSLPSFGSLTDDENELGKLLDILISHELIRYTTVKGKKYWKVLELTPKGGVVVLSPATASFDMFPNYKERGNQFKKEVNKL